MSKKTLIEKIKTYLKIIKIKNEIRNLQRRRDLVYYDDIIKLDKELMQIENEIKDKENFINQLKM